MTDPRSPDGGTRHARSATLAAASLAGGVALAGWRAALPNAAAALPPLPSAVLFTVVWAFAIWTWLRLARTHRAADDALVYDHGVRRFGFAMGGTMAVWTALRPRWPLHITSGTDLAELGFILAISFLTSVPVAMWGGYLWGRVMAAVFHVPKRPGDRRPDVLYGKEKPPT